MRKNLKNYYKNMMHIIMDEYQNEYNFLKTKEQTAYCYVGKNDIYIPEIYDEIASSKTLFDIFHEIGHLKTNTFDMETYEQEYKATVWAIEECNRRKIGITRETMMIYQRYIIDWKNKSPNASRIKESSLVLPNNKYVAVPDDNYRLVDEQTFNKPRVIVSTDENIIDYLNRNHIDYVDKRMRGGNLTIIGEKKSIYKIVDTLCSMYGITGGYSDSLRAIHGRAGWWTKG